MPLAPAPGEVSARVPTGPCTKWQTTTTSAPHLPASVALTKDATSDLMELGLTGGCTVLPRAHRCHRHHFPRRRRRRRHLQTAGTALPMQLRTPSQFPSIRPHHPRPHHPRLRLHRPHHPSLHCASIPMMAGSGFSLSARSSAVSSLCSRSTLRERLTEAYAHQR